MGRWGDGEMGRWEDGEMGRWADGESTLVRRFPPLREVVNPKGEMGRWEDGGTRRQGRILIGNW